jgi:hypothetical protein
LDNASKARGVNDFFFHNLIDLNEPISYENPSSSPL